MGLEADSINDYNNKAEIIWNSNSVGHVRGAGFSGQLDCDTCFETSKLSFSANFGDNGIYNYNNYGESGTTHSA